MRFLVWLCVATILVAVSGNDDDVCNRSLLPWDFDLFPYVDKDVKNGEVHINGEYLLYQKGEEQYSQEYGGIIHTMKVCSPPDGCESTMFVRYSISPLKVADFRLVLLKHEDSGDVEVSQSFGKGNVIEQQIASELEHGGVYSIVVVYNTDGREMPRCASVWMELVLARHVDYSQGPIRCSGASPTTKPDLNFAEQIKQKLQSDRYADIPTSFHYETDIYEAPSKMDDFRTVHVTAPEIRGHDGFWKLRMEIRTPFLTGGHWLAMLSTDRTSTLESTEVTHGTRGSYKNVYILEQMITSLDDFYLHIESISTKTGETPVCSPYYISVDLEATTIDESFMTCGFLPLPASLNSPGFYDPEISQDMAVAHEVLLSSKKLSQNSSLEVKHDNLMFKVTVAHSTIDVNLKLYEEGATVPITAWMGVYGTEGITTMLKRNTVYRLHIDHVFDPVAFSGTTVQHCNSAVLRMEIAQAPAKKTATNTLPDIAIPSPLNDDWEFKGPAATDGNEYPFMFAYTKKTQEVIEHYEFEVTDPGQMEIFVPNRFIHGEVIASVASLHANSVQLGEFVFQIDGTTKLTPKSVSNPCGRSPNNEHVGNLLKDSKTKWLDFNKSPVVFTFEEATEISQYYLVTANDHSERDPVEWVLYGTNSEASDEELLGDQCNNLSPDLVVVDEVKGSPHNPDAVPAGQWQKSQIFSTDRVQYKRYVFVPTALRRTSSKGDFKYSESKLDGSFLSVSLHPGQYRLSLLTGWGDLYQDENDGIPKCASFGLQVKFVKGGTCDVRTIEDDSKMGTLTRDRHYMYGEYQIPSSGSLKIEFEILKGSHLHLDIIASEIPTRSVKVQYPDGKSKSAEDWFQDGLGTLAATMTESGVYNLYIDWDQSDLSCARFRMQLSISAFPSSTPPCTSNTIDQLAPLIGPGMTLPFNHTATYKTKVGNEYAGDDGKRLRMLMYIEKDAEIRALINYNFETTHVYLSICKCPDAEAERDERGCWECNYRSTSISNGNHLTAQKIGTGYYEVKFRSPPNDLKTPCDDYMVNLFITPLVSDDASTPTLCGHSLLLPKLVGPGMIDGTINEMHFATEALVPKAVPNGRPIAKTRLEIHVDSVVRIWIPSKADVSVNNTNLYQLATNTEEANRFWPQKTQVGSYGINSKTGSIFHMVPKGNYIISLTFNDVCTMMCSTYDFEISVIPQAKLEQMKDDNCPMSDLPDKLTHGDAYGAHTERKRPFPNSEISFKHTILFNIVEESGGRIDARLMSNFETGGLVTEVRRISDNTIAAYPIRYLHRDYLQQDLPVGEYELVIRDPADHFENKLLADLINCNRFRMHLSLEGSSFESCLRYDDIESKVISNSETEQNFIFYEHVKIKNGQQTLKFVVPTSQTVLKVMAETVLEDVTIQLELSSHGATIAFSSTGSLEVPNLERGSYSLIITVNTDTEATEIREKTCELQLKRTSFSLSIGIIRDREINEYQKEFCGNSNFPDLPTSFDIKTTDVASESEFTIPSTSFGINKQFTREIDLNINPTYEGGTLTLVLKYNYLAMDIDLKLLTGSDYVVNAVRTADASREQYTTELWIHHEIVPGPHKLILVGTTQSCLSFYISMVGSEKDAANGKIAMVNPWLAREILPSRPYVVRLVLSKPATFTSDRIAVAKMRPTGDKAGRDDVSPSRATFENGQSIVRLEFGLEYGTNYDLMVDGTKLNDNSGNPFVANPLIPDAMKFITAACSCLDALHCDWGSPCPCSRCTRCPSGRTTDGVCVDDGIIAPTPIPTDKPQEPTSGPPITDAPKVTHAPNTLPPGGSSGGGSSVKSVLVILLLVGLVLTLLYVGHSKGYLYELPCFKPTPRRPTIAPVADESLFMDDDIDDDDDDVNLNPVEGVSNAADPSLLRQEPEDTTPQTNINVDDDDNLFGDEVEPGST